MATRNAQIVSTKKQRKFVMEWIMKEVEECGTAKKSESKQYKNLNQFLRYQTIYQNFPAFANQIADGMKKNNFLTLCLQEKTE